MRMQLRSVACAGALGIATAAAAAVGVDARGLFIEDTFLAADSLVAEVERLAREHPDVDTIWLKNIPGGLIRHAPRLKSVFENRRVHVTGFCNSLCAWLALQGTTLTLHDDAFPSTLVIHGSFDLTSQQWSPRSLEQLDFYASRLSGLSRDLIEKALSFRQIGTISGLVIASHPIDRIGGARGPVYVCEEYPTRCEDAGIGSLDQIRITLHPVVRGKGSGVDDRCADASCEPRPGR